MGCPQFYGSLTLNVDSVFNLGLNLKINFVKRKRFGPPVRPYDILPSCIEVTPHGIKNGMPTILWFPDTQTRNQNQHALRPRDTRPQAARTLQVDIFELGPKKI